MKKIVDLIIKIFFGKAFEVDLKIEDKILSQFIGE